ncbi:hypothetical protein BTO04_10185 [Polaribacter sp. SA4-10]|uniref:hypothetical protein n=1 Tax=Polaribacter sp. SA4-10 TaxID=754397 RepID=UPI000B3CB01A|nr:hypothetical protein [Polaribacter sp. SA4-10]ARV07032.1 hypothetical protein BTO04_10185 [Polaribacter sp. SA4-10]
MKKIVLLFIFLFTTIIQAQNGYRNGQRQRQRQMPQTQQKAPDPDFKIEKYLGIVLYDIEKSAKKSKIKLASEEGKQFSKVLTKYNKDIKSFTRINSFLLRSTKDMVDNYQKLAMESGDYSNQLKVQKVMMENLKPISETLKKEDLKLDKTIKSLLSEKQYKKWIKYNRKIYKIFPKEE